MKVDLGEALMSLFERPWMINEVSRPLRRAVRAAVLVQSQRRVIVIGDPALRRSAVLVEIPLA
jgi:hypothetical protein